MFKSNKKQQYTENNNEGRNKENLHQLVNRVKKTAQI